MSLQEIKNLSDEELCAELHCLVYPEIGKRIQPERRIGSWQCAIEIGVVSNYCTDLNAIAEVEKIVIEKVGKYEYGKALINLAGMSGSHLTGISSNGICEIAMLPARQRAEACLAALSVIEEQK